MMHQVATAGIYPFSLRQKNPQKCSLSWALNDVKMILFYEVQNWTIQDGHGILNGTRLISRTPKICMKICKILYAIDHHQKILIQYGQVSKMRPIWASCLKTHISATPPCSAALKAISHYRNNLKYWDR